VRTGSDSSSSFGGGGRRSSDVVGVSGDMRCEDILVAVVVVVVAVPQ